MDEAFDARLEFHECAVGYEAGNFAFDFEVDGVFLCDFVPRIFGLLFEAEGDAFFVAVDFEDHDVDVLADFEHFGGVADASPTHVGDVEESVESVEVDEGAEVGDVFDGAGDDGAFFEFVEELRAFFGALFFNQFAA